MAVHQEAKHRWNLPAYRQTGDHAPKLPNRPTPHIPHRTGRVLATTLAVAVAATAVDAYFKGNHGTHPADAPGVTLQNQENFMFNGNHLVNLSVSSEGEITKRTTSVPQVLEAKSFNLEEGQGLKFVENIAAEEYDQKITVVLPADQLDGVYFVPVLGNTYGQDTKDTYTDALSGDVALAHEPITPDPFGSVHIDRFGINAGIQLRLSASDGTPIEGPNGKPIYARPSDVNLSIPEVQNQAPTSM